MYSAIQATLSNIQMQFGPSTHKWIGFFTPFDVLIRVRPYIREEAFMTFDVHDDGRISFTHTKIDAFSFCLQKEVRVVANDRSN